MLTTLISLISLAISLFVLYKTKPISRNHKGPGNIILTPGKGEDGSEGVVIIQDSDGKDVMIIDKYGYRCVK